MITRMITHLTSPEALDGDEIVVDGEAYRHLFRARRLALGIRLRVVDGGGRARWAEVTEVDRRRAQLELGETAPSHEPSYKLTLIVAALRPERASWLVEKVTEVGVVAVRFLATERTPRKYGKGSVERWRRVATSAVEQCHRSRRPEISGVHTWEELPELLAGVEERWFLDVGGGGAESRLAGAGSGAVLIGPEGGWDDAERGALAELGASSVSLGQRVLRVETAAVVASSRVLL